MAQPKVCPDCKGTGVSTSEKCSHCGGDGVITGRFQGDVPICGGKWDSEPDRECIICGGAGYIKYGCKTCHGKGYF